MDFLRRFRSRGDDDFNHHTPDSFEDATVITASNPLLPVRQPQQLTRLPQEPSESTALIHSKPAQSTSLWTSPTYQLSDDDSSSYVPVVSRESPRIQFLAHLKRIEFQIGQYRSYYDMPDGGVHPRDFGRSNNEMGLVQNGEGPCAFSPPQTFWNLVTVRDRLITECMVLDELLASAAAAASQQEHRSMIQGSRSRLRRRTCLFSSAAVCIAGISLAWWGDTNSTLQAVSGVVATAAGLNAARVVGTQMVMGWLCERCRGDLQSLIERAGRWEELQARDQECFGGVNFRSLEYFL